MAVLQSERYPVGIGDESLCLLVVFREEVVDEIPNGNGNTVGTTKLPDIPIRRRDTQWEMGVLIPPSIVFSLYSGEGWMYVGAVLRDLR